MTNQLVARAAAATGIAVLISASACALEELPDEEELSWEEVVGSDCEPIPEDAEDYHLLERIEEMGLCASTAVDMGDEYLVEGDIVVPKEQLLHKQRRHTNLLSCRNVNPITVRFDSNVPNAWRTATLSAINVWNGVSSASIRLVFTTAATADIRVTSANLAGNVVADALLPFLSSPGSRIRVNSDFDNLAASTKLTAMVHELGHTIGFHHTNKTNGVHIPGTPTSDPGSVMHSSVSPWSGLTSGDSLGLRIMYPFHANLNVEYTGCRSGTAKYLVDWGSPASCFIDWQLQRKIGSGSYTTISSGSPGSLLYNAPSATRSYFRARARHSNRGWSSFRTRSFVPPNCHDNPPEPF